MTDKANTPIPSFLTRVTGELGGDYWRPQTFQEWSDMTATSALITVWVEQQSQERGLRKIIGVWVFVLITIQILAVFALIVLDAIKVLSLNVKLVEFLIPSVLGEVFGMGFVVVKYLFKANLSPPLTLGKITRD